MHPKFVNQGNVEHTRNLTRAFPRKFFQTKELCDITDTHSNMGPDSETSSEQSNCSLTNPGSWKYNLRHYQTPNCNDDWCATERIRSGSKNSMNTLQNQYEAFQKLLYSVLAIDWQLTHSLFSPTYFTTRLLKLNQLYLLQRGRMYVTLSKIFSSPRLFG